MKRYLILSIYGDGDAFISEDDDEIRALRNASFSDMSQVYVLDRQHTDKRGGDCWSRVIYRAVDGQVFPNDIEAAVREELK